MVEFGVFLDFLVFLGRLDYMCVAWDVILFRVGILWVGVLVSKFLVILDFCLLRGCVV